MNLRHRLGNYVVVLMLAILVSACGDDLSDLDALAKESVLNDSTNIEITTELSVDQVVSPVAVTSDSDAEAQLLVNLSSNTISGQVGVTPQQNTMVRQVQIRKGFGGQNGNVVLNLSPDATDSDRWYVPDNYLLSNEDVELLLRGGLYVLVTTSNHANGELRGQLLLGGQELLINPLTADQVASSNSGSLASATSYLSVDYITGEIHGSVLHADDLLPTQVSMQTGLAGLEGEAILQYQADLNESGVWHIPEHTVLPTSLLEQLDSAQLYVQASSISYPNGEIRGQLHLFHYIVTITELSGMNLMPEINTIASGKAFSI